MLIKKSSALTLANILNSIKINKFEDKESKLAFIHNHLAVRKVANDITSDQNEIIDKFRDDWGAEVKEISELRKDGKDVVGHDAFLKAEKEADELLNNMLNSEIDVDLQPVALDRFISSFTDEDITLEYIAFLTENGILE